MKRLILMCCLINKIATAQYSDKVWCFGDSAGINFSNPNSPQTFTSQIKSIVGSTSAADTNGNLIYYIGANDIVFNDHVKIFSSIDSIIQNGDSIICNYMFGLTAIPYPNVKNRFVVFSKSHFTGNNGCYYSMFEMDYTFTNGTVLIKNNQLLPITGAFIAAIRHGNGRDWWVLTKDANSVLDTIYSFLVTPAGIQGPFKQNINTILGYATIQYLCFNNKGDELVYTTLSGVIEKYDFDRCTGLLSNKIIISTETPINLHPPFYLTSCFSPNDSLLYITSAYDNITTTNGNRLYQINLAAPLLTLDTMYHFQQPVSVGMLKLAPDNKIYIASETPAPYVFYKDTDYNAYNTYLGVINEPNKLGMLCDLQPFSFYLGGKRTYSYLPNNPNYNLGALVGSVCDTLVSGVAPAIAANARLTLNYIANWQKLFVNATKLRGKNCTLKVYSINGNLVYQSKAKSNPPFFTAEINCTGMATGVYILNLTTELESVTGKFFKE